MTSSEDNENGTAVATGADSSEEGGHLIRSKAVSRRKMSNQWPE